MTRDQRDMSERIEEARDRLANEMYDTGKPGTLACYLDDLLADLQQIHGMVKR